MEAVVLVVRVGKGSLASSPEASFDKEWSIRTDGGGRIHTLIMSAGTQIQVGRIEAVALRQLLQLSVTIMGRWAGWSGIAKGCSGRADSAGTEIRYRIARQLHPPLMVKGSDGRGMVGITITLALREKWQESGGGRVGNQKI